MTKIIVCICKHVYQDEKYGENKRVMNKTKAGGYCCTVCTKIKS